MSETLLKPEQLKQWRQIFHLFDRTGDGVIEMKELGTIMRALWQNPTDAELQDLINDVDLDGSGRLDFLEFVNIMTGRLKDTDTSAELKYTFDVFDTDKDGILTPENLTDALQEIGEKSFSAVEILEIIKELDVDGNNRVKQKEFLDVMLAL
eukprot:GSMAST32.ASY1.ANO1.894.1 assembled CDS